MMKFIKAFRTEIKGVKIMLGNKVTKPYRFKYFSLMLAHHIVGILNALVSLPFAFLMIVGLFTIKAVELTGSIIMVTLSFIKKVTFLHYLLPMIEKARTNLAALS